ncbi:MAG: hypothetical protein RLZZ597_3439 [Cyanobacteriota bacterium]|jgi:hypothetical protein
MGAKSRRKGQSGEREAIHALEALLGVPLSREHGQSANGGHDCTIPLGGGVVVALEVKRCESEEHGPWWTQAVLSAARLPCGIPVVVWRRSRQPWRVRVPLGWLLGCDWPLDGWVDTTAVLSLEAFALVLRDRGAGANRG